MHRRQLLHYSIDAVLWGFSFLVLLRVVDAFGWVGASAFRALVAGGTLVLAALVTRRRLHFDVGLRHFAVLGATTVGIQLLGLSYSSPRIGTALTAIFVGTIPLFSMVIGQVWGLERITPAGRVGLALGFAGIVLLVGFPTQSITPSFLLGCGVALASAVAAAFGSNYSHRFLRQVGSWEQTSGAFLFGGLFCLPLLLIVPVPRVPGVTDVLWLVFLASAMSAATYVLYFRLVAEVGATIAISVEFVVTTIAIIVGAVVLDERLSAVQLLGAAVVILGCTMVIGLVPRRKSRPDAAVPVHR